MTTPIACAHAVPRVNSQGLDGIEVSHDQRSLTVRLLADVSSGSPLLDPASYTLTGGRRLHPRVTNVALGAPKQVVLTLDQPGDFSLYTLTVRGDRIDPFFGSKRFSFKIECEDPFDCRPAPVPAPEEPESPVTDYLTKDYAGFRQLLLDALPARLPGWTERSEADVGIALAELLAETADRLSYYQDRVANEAFLETATQRRSVQLHTALTGYRMRPGMSASTHLFFEANRDSLIPAGTRVCTETEGREPAVIFETGPHDVDIWREHNELEIYDWGNAQCCLSAGAVQMALVGDRSRLRAGDAILIADLTDRDRREIVRLAADPVVIPKDEFRGHPTKPLTLVRWSPSQALRWDYCLAPRRTIARANLVSASHGETVRGGEELGLGDESIRLLRLPLARAPLTYTAGADGSPVSSLTVDADGEPWTERESLVESGPFDTHYRVELDDDGFATVVFGRDRAQSPITGAKIVATYRFGIGPAGNVGRDTLRFLLLDQEDGTREAVTANDAVASVTNPLAASGGESPEDAREAKRVAPLRVRVQQRCVTEADYETAATDYRSDGRRQVQRARARFVWTGSWHTVFVSVDPVGGETLSSEVRAGLHAYLQERKLTGFDLEVGAATYVPLVVGLRICVRSDSIAGDVRSSLLRVLSNRTNPDRSLGFFHADRYTFGDPLVVSRLYAAVEATPGVDSVVITALNRLHQREPDEATRQNLKRGFLPIGEMEIVRLDNDPSFPENGRLVLELIGGR
jgi:hypothetical protein